VGAVLAGQLVVAVPAFDQVRQRAALQDVIAAIALDPVVGLVVKVGPVVIGDGSGGEGIGREDVGIRNRAFVRHRRNVLAGHRDRDRRDVGDSGMCVGCLIG